MLTLEYNYLFMAIRIFYLFVILCLFSCDFSTSKRMSKSDDQMLEDLFQIMQGSYSSAAQASADSNYYNISLHMYPIWQDKTESKWLYVEQALYSKQDQPYRVRVYELKAHSDELIESKVYTLKDQDKFIGKWNDSAYFDAYDHNILEEREGCAVYLKSINDKKFEGATRDKECKSSLRGASYASSKVQVEPDRITSWDQGFDAEDNQVWGATKGAYIFIKE